MERSKADSFSAFLEARQRSKLRSATGSGTPLALLNALADAGQKQMPVKDLMTASGMAITDFADALKSLQASGYLTLSGSPLAELARLTALGEEVSRLARPA